MGKAKVVVNKPVYLGQAILDMSKIVMYEFHYDYMKPTYGENLKLCYMDTDSLVYHIKTKDFYVDIASYVEERFDTSGYDKEDARPLPMRLRVYSFEPVLFLVAFFFQNVYFFNTFFCKW